jgi:ATP-binding cassette subfamily C protein
MIAHRLSTVRDADKILYLDCGRVLALGTFEEIRSKIPEFDHQAKLMGL